MPSLKEVRNRIASVNSTQQITKAMKMVSAAKLRRAQDNMFQLRPYAQKLAQMLSTVSAGADTAQSSPFRKIRSVKKALVIVVTSDRGLCGAFNTNVGKAGITLIAERYGKENVVIMPIGKKGMEFFQRRGFQVNAKFSETFTNLSFAKVRLAAEDAMQQFLDGTYDEVFIIYNEFKNVATQIIRTEQFLPIVDKKQDKKQAVSNTDYIFEPSEEEIVNELIPKSLKIQLYRAVLESNASEHGARMTAMDKATENAGELIRALRLEYNRSRQAAITKEILEIVGGAEALNN
ncbi:MAG: ATP synthase F1 subunit gamma [Spirosomataceae bacterium]